MRGREVGPVVWTAWVGLALLGTLGWFVGDGALRILRFDANPPHASPLAGGTPNVPVAAGQATAVNRGGMHASNGGAGAVDGAVRSSRVGNVVNSAASGVIARSRSIDAAKGNEGPSQAGPGLEGDCCVPNATLQAADDLPHPAGCRFILPNTVLLFQPPMVRGQLPPCLNLDLWLDPATRFITSVPAASGRGEKLGFSVVINVFNHETTIERVLRQVLKLTTESFEVILFFDGCTDGSLARARGVVQRYLAGWPRCDSDAAIGDPAIECTAATSTPSAPAASTGTQAAFAPAALFRGVSHVRFIVQPPLNPVYETTGNNLAMRAAVGTFTVLMQDDMYLTELGWNSRLAAAPREYPDVFSVSAMCAHSLHPLGQQKVGPCGAMAAFARRRTVRKAQSDRTTDTVDPQSSFVIRGTSNRGPLLLDAAKLKTLGYLDEMNYRIMNDDHDLHCRAALDHRWVTGHVEVGFSVNVAEGGVRVNKKREKPPYERHFIHSRAKRYNRRDCYRARKAEYMEGVRNGTVVSEGVRPLQSLRSR